MQSRPVSRLRRQGNPFHSDTLLVERISRSTLSDDALVAFLQLPDADSVRGHRLRQCAGFNSISPGMPESANDTMQVRAFPSQPS